APASRLDLHAQAGNPGDRLLGDAADLRDDLDWLLPRNDAPVDVDGAAIRDDIGLDAALDQRDAGRRRVEVGVSALRQFRPQLVLQGDDHPGHALDRVGALPGERAVGGPAVDRDADTLPALLADADAVQGLLADDDEVGSDVVGLGDQLGAEPAADLLIGHGIDD